MGSCLLLRRADDARSFLLIECALSRGIHLGLPSLGSRAHCPLISPSVPTRTQSPFLPLPNHLRRSSSLLSTVQLPLVFLVSTFCVFLSVPVRCSFVKSVHVLRDRIRFDTRFGCGLSYFSSFGSVSRFLRRARASLARSNMLSCRTASCFFSRSIRASALFYCVLINVLAGVIFFGFLGQLRCTPV